MPDLLHYAQSVQEIDPGGDKTRPWTDPANAAGEPDAQYAVCYLSFEPPGPSAIYEPATPAGGEILNPITEHPAIYTRASCEDLYRMSYILAFSGFGFTEEDLPEDAVIRGLEVTVPIVHDPGRGLGAYVDYAWFTVGTVVQGEHKRPQTELPSGQQVLTLGGEDDTWGKSDWTASTIRDANFQFRLVFGSMDEEDCWVSVDAMSLEIVLETGNGNGHRKGPRPIRRIKRPQSRYASVSTIPRVQVGK